MTEDAAGPVPRERIERRPDGRIAVRLVARERAILRALVEDLGAVLEAGPGLPDAGDGPDDGWEEDSFAGAGSGEPEVAGSGGPAGAVDPALARLYPDARPDDPAWSRRFRRLVGPDLAAGRQRQLAVVEGTLEERSLDDAQGDAWLHVLNDVRLVMATRLGITDDGGEEDALDPADPDAAARLLYAWVGWLEGQLVDALAASLPVHPDDLEGPDPDDASIAADDS